MDAPQHLLVIRLSAMGDVAMTVPVLSVLRKTYPELKITVLSRPFFKPLFDQIPNIDFLEADVKNTHKGLGILKLAAEAKALGIDAVADLHDVLRTKILRTHFRINGIRVKTIDKGRREKKALVSGNPKYFKPLKSTHQRYADVFSELGFPVNLSEYHPPKKLPLTENLKNLISENLEKKLIGIAPFAAHEGKMYPWDLMKETIVQLETSGAYKIFLFGGKEDADVLKRMETPSRSIVSVAGTLKFQEELILISQLDAMISMDSGNGHLAAIFGVPVITLWGVTHPYAGFAPFNQPEKNQILADRKTYPLIPTSIYGNKFPEGYEDAMKTIHPEGIVRILEDRLGEGKRENKE